MPNRRRFRRILRWGIGIVVGLAIALLAAIFAFGPAFVEKRFNPITNVSERPPTESIQELHRSLTIVDLHADSLLWGRELSESASYGHVDIPRLIEGNVALQAFTVVTQVPMPLRVEGNSSDRDSIVRLALLQRWPVNALFSLQARALYQAGRLRDLADNSEGQFSLIETRQDLEHYLERRQSDRQITAGLLGLEGAQALEGKLDNLDRLFEAGFRFIGLAHFFDNEVSGSAHGIERGGLTEFGRRVVSRMDELGMIVDLAHASAQTTDEVVDMTDRPVIVSHTGVKGTCDNNRNLSDLQIDRIASTGGIIGIGFWPTAVCGSDAAAIARAIKYVSDRVGVEHVALGSDFDGAVSVPFDVANMDRMTLALREAGFDDSDIEKIMGANVITLLLRLLPIA